MAPPTPAATTTSAALDVAPAPSAEPVTMPAVNRDIVFLGVFSALTLTFAVLVALAYAPEPTPRRSAGEASGVAVDPPPAAAPAVRHEPRTERRNGHAHALSRSGPDTADPAFLVRHLAGLEERFFNGLAEAERNAIVAEVERLQAAHGDDAAFAAAAEKFLTAAYIDAILR